jgi:cob(I)alamin adenosyltransferase
MTKLTGRVAYRDIETGVWVLEGDDGTTYQLAGGDRKIKKDGHRIEVEGDVDRNVLTSAMVGPVFNVARYRFL